MWMIIAERLNAYIHLFHQNLNINEVAEQQKYRRGGRDRGSQHSAGLGAGPERADAQGAGGSRPDRAKGPGASEPRRAAAGAVACAEPGGRPAAGTVAGGASGAWRPIDGGPVVACGATAGGVRGSQTASLVRGSSISVLGLLVLGLYRLLLLCAARRLLTLHVG